jgi:hypothetical protein
LARFLLAHRGKMLGLHLLLWLTSLFLPNAIPQGAIYGGTSGGGGSISISSFAVNQQDSSATTVATATTLNIPSGAVAHGACAFQATTDPTMGGQTISFSDGTNTYTQIQSQFNAAAGTFATFQVTNATAASGATGTCTLSATTGGANTEAVLFWYTTGLATSSSLDVSTAGNANDGGSSGTAITSASFSTTNAAEEVDACAMTSVNDVWTVGTIGGLTPTLQNTSFSGVGGGPGNGILACETSITSSTLSTQTANFTYGASTRWNISINSFH